MHSRFLVGLTASLFCTTPALADVRIIKDDSGTADIGAQLQSQNMTTPFISPGGTISIERSSSNFIWVYELFIDAIPTSISEDSKDVTYAKQTASISSTLSSILLPVLSVPSSPNSPGSVTSSKAPAKVFEVFVDRNAAIGSTIHFTISKPTGKIEFTGRVACPVNAGFETKSKLVSAASSADAIGAGAQANLVLNFDMPPPCGTQPLQISLPRCIETVNPGSSNRVSFLSLTLEPNDRKSVTLPLFGVATGQCRSGGGGDIRITTNDQTKTVPVRYFDTALLPKVQSLVPQQGVTQPGAPQMPTGAVAPKPKPI